MNPEDDDPKPFDAYVAAMRILEAEGPLRPGNAAVLAREYVHACEQISALAAEARIADERVAEARIAGRQEGYVRAALWLLAKGTGHVPRDAAAIRSLDPTKE